MEEIKPYTRYGVGSITQLEKVKNQLLNKETGVQSCDKFTCKYHQVNNKMCIAGKEQLKEIGCFKRFGEKRSSD